MVHCFYAGDFMMLELERDRVLPSLQNANNMDAQDQGYATPGHMEEHDFITAFFQNQDHDAVSLVYIMDATLLTLYIQ